MKIFIGVILFILLIAGLVTRGVVKTNAYEAACTELGGIVVSRKGRPTLCFRTESIIKVEI